MTSVQDIHRKAMALADLALSAKRQADLVKAREYFRQALDLEKQAARSTTGEPTRSVFFRSAATLAIDCGEIQQAEELIDEGLSGDPPPEILEELQELRDNLPSRRPVGKESS